MNSLSKPFLKELVSKHMPLNRAYANYALNQNHIVDMDVSVIRIPTINDINLLKDTFKYTELYNDSSMSTTLNTMLEKVYEDFNQLKERYSDTKISNSKDINLFGKLVTDYILHTVWRTISYDYKTNIGIQFSTSLDGENVLTPILDLGYTMISKLSTNEEYTYNAISDSCREMLLNMNSSILEEPDDILKAEASVFGIEGGKIHTFNYRIFPLRYTLHLLVAMNNIDNSIQMITFIKCNHWYHNSACYKIDTKITLPFEITK